MQWDCVGWVNDRFDLLDSSDRIHRYRENELGSKLCKTTQISNTIKYDHERKNLLLQRETGMNKATALVCVLVSTDKTVHTIVSQLWGAWLALTVHVKIFRKRKRGGGGDCDPISSEKGGGQSTKASQPV